MRSEILIPLLVMLGQVGCGGGGGRTGPKGTGATNSAVIGAAGGSITLEGVTVMFPPGALTMDTTITLTSTLEQPPETFDTWNSPVYAFAPEGLVFAKPVVVSMDFTGSPTNAGLY